MQIFKINQHGILKKFMWKDYADSTSQIVQLMSSADRLPYELWSENDVGYDYVVI